MALADTLAAIDSKIKALEAEKRRSAGIQKQVQQGIQGLGVYYTEANLDKQIKKLEQRRNETIEKSEVVNIQSNNLIGNEPPKATAPKQQGSLLIPALIGGLILFG